jgi:hypothetical protein
LFYCVWTATVRLIKILMAKMCFVLIFINIGRDTAIDGLNQCLLIGSRTLPTRGRPYRISCNTAM